ncbi:hypothetical protein TorRG33x02_116490 [Trema orientale]|uniref:Transmembrane protein n=1 Tax=Trema orientale TaxID=63057 RepID=A0A2P5F447_TREOI|nr:hypothetical protein TorRG33x02_116490 [Trema orientale]
MKSLHISMNYKQCNNSISSSNSITSDYMLSVSPEFTFYPDQEQCKSEALFYNTILNILCWIMLDIFFFLFAFHEMDQHLLGHHVIP